MSASQHEGSALPGGCEAPSWGRSDADQTISGPVGGGYNTFAGSIFIATFGCVTMRLAVLIGYINMFHKILKLILQTGFYLILCSPTQAADSETAPNQTELTQETCSELLTNSVTKKLEIEEADLLMECAIHKGYEFEFPGWDGARAQFGEEKTILGFPKIGETPWTSGNR